MADIHINRQDTILTSWLPNVLLIMGMLCPFLLFGCSPTAESDASAPNYAFLPQGGIIDRAYPGISVCMPEAWSDIAYQNLATRALQQWLNAVREIDPYVNASPTGTRDVQFADDQTHRKPIEPEI